MSSVEFKGVSKAFGRTIAVEETDLVVQQGEFFSMLGPSGCGKSTTLRCAPLGSAPPPGPDLVNGRDITTLAARGARDRHRFPELRDFPALVTLTTTLLSGGRAPSGQGHYPAQGGGGARSGRIDRLRRAFRARVVGRPETAGRAGPCAGHRARDPAPRRTSLGTGQENARGHEIRDQGYPENHSELPPSM